MLSQRSYKTALKRYLLRRKNPYDVNRPPRPRPPRKPFRWRPKKMDIDYPSLDDPMDVDEPDQLWEMDSLSMDYVMEDVSSSEDMLLCLSPALGASSPIPWRSPSPPSCRALVSSPPAHCARVPCPLPRRGRVTSSSPRRCLSPALRRSLSPLARRSRSPSPPRGRGLVRSSRGRLATPSPPRGRRLVRSSRGGLTSPAGWAAPRSPTPPCRSRSRTLSYSPSPRPRSRAPSPDAGSPVSCPPPNMGTAGQCSRPASPYLRDISPPNAGNVDGAKGAMDMLQLLDAIQELDEGSSQPSSQMAELEEKIFRSPDPLLEAGFAWGFVDYDEPQDGEPEDDAGGTSDSSG
ncbi:hypothetical protein INT44_008457 [Umbelopsis vinacea]|uniref:Uncharacterized protein n=1 Tax=Umbelopsis vinacea TaxID=44442 RepID=A0A8H7UH87_9FUNG|nr:hypothetical protein INT44_008457 [Umbelopsis vinacea]